MKKRIIVWAMALAFSIAYIAGDVYNKSLPVEDTKLDTLWIYNDVGSESSVKDAFNNTSMSSTNKLEFSSKISGADCILTEDLSKLSADDENIFTSYTPLIIGMKNSKELQEYKKSELLVSSKEINNTIEDEISINFKKVMDAVINGDDWSVFGGEEKEIRIIVPAADSTEGKIFYNFLVVTANNGSYPSNDETLKSAKETADMFLKSPSCIETEDVINELKKISSINTTDMYVLFEADFINSCIWSEKKLDISLTYPSVTIVKHIYIQSSEEVKEMSKFFNALSTELNYRTSDNYSFTENKNYNVKDRVTFTEVSILIEKMSVADVEKMNVADKVCLILEMVMVIAFGIMISILVISLIRNWVRIIRW